MKLKSTILFLFLTLSFLKIISQPINFDFNAGNINGWTLEEGSNLGAYSKNIGGIQPSTQYSIMLATSTETNTVPITMTSPLGGNFVRIGNTNTGGATFKLTQTYTVDASSANVSFAYALVMDNGGHLCDEQNYFELSVKDASGNVIPANVNNQSILNSTSCSSGDPSYTAYSHFGYKNWNNVSYSLSNYIGTSVTVELLVAGCIVFQGAHPGYAYFDASFCNNATTPTSVLVNGTQYPITQSTSTINLCGSLPTTIWAPVGATSFTWTGGTINGATSQSVTINQAGAYSLLCNKPFACSNTTKVSFLFGSNPSLSVAVSSSVSCPGTSKSLTASGASNYTWTTVSGTSQISTNSPTYNISPFVTSVYKITGRDAFGCLSSINYTVPVSPSPTLSVVGSSLICSSSPVVLTVSGADTYTWVGGSNSNSISVTPTVNSTYSVTGTAFSTGCSATYNHTLNVGSSVLVNSNKYKLCVGDSAIVTSTGATSYTWSNGATTNTVILKPTATTTYTLNGNTSCGIKQSVFTLTVNALPTLTVVANPPNVCGTYSAGLYGLGSLNYSWQPPLSAGGWASPTVATTYTATGTDANGCKNTNTLTVSVFPAATISISSPTAICAGQSATLTANGISSYTWSNGSTTQSIVVSPTINSSYSVYGYDMSGACGSLYSNLQVSSGTPSLNIAVKNFTTCPGSYIGLSITTPTNYAFSTVPPISASYSGGYLNLLPAPSVATNYTVNANNACGVASSTIMVTPQANPTVVLSAPDTICKSMLSTFSAAGSASFTWQYSYNGSSWISAPSGNTFTIVPVSTFSVFVYGNTGGCNTSGITKKIIVINDLDIVASNTTICAGGSTTLTGIGSTAYLWSNGATTNSIIVTPSVNTIYTLTGTSSTSCTISRTISINVNPNPIIAVNSGTICEGSSFTISPSGATSYTYSGGSSIVSPIVNTNYTITATNFPTCSGMATVVSSVVVIPKPTVTVNSGSVCAGNIFTIIPSGATVYSYSSGLQNVSPLVNTNYTVIGTNAQGCVSNPAICSVTVNPLPIISVNSGSICSGQNFTMTPSGGTIYIYSNGNNVVSPTTTTNYTITGGDANNCINTAISNVNVGVMATPITVNNGTICSGTSFTIIPSGAFTYSYSSGSAVVSPSVSSDYTVTATSASSCVSTVSAVCSVIVNPTPTITVNSGTICSNENFTITPGGAITYTYSTGSNIVSTPSSNTTVTVTGTDANGCENNVGDVSTITVNSVPTLTVSPGTSVCEGSSIQLNSGGADTYTWSTGATSASIAITPTVTDTYTVTGANLSNCSSTETVSVVVDNTCQDVWPGDANSDGWADNLDVLEMGLHFLQTGPVRPAGLNNSWQSFYANDWVGNITNGKNVNHSDCNGDGTINDDDTLAVFNNYGLNHAFRPNTQITTVPELTIVPDQVYVTKGSWGSSSIYLGEALTPVNNINGIAFTVNFDNTLIEPNSIWIEYPTSFINTANQNLHFRKLNFSTSSLFTATTHTINNDVSGNGLIGILHYKILSSLATDETLLLELFQGYKSETSGLITPVTVGSGTLMAIGASVGLQELSGNVVSISPNPTNGSLTINSKTQLQKIELIAVTGQILLSEVPISTSHTLHLDDLANSIYFVNVYQNNRIVKREKIVLNK